MTQKAQLLLKVLIIELFIANVFVAYLVGYFDVKVNKIYTSMLRSEYNLNNSITRHTEEVIRTKSVTKYAQIAKEQGFKRPTEVIYIDLKKLRITTSPR